MPTQEKTMLHKISSKVDAGHKRLFDKLETGAVNNDLVNISKWSVSYDKEGTLLGICVITPVNAEDAIQLIAFGESNPDGKTLYCVGWEFFHVPNGGSGSLKPGDSATALSFTELFQPQPGPNTVASEIFGLILHKNGLNEVFNFQKNFTVNG